MPMRSFALPTKNREIIGFSALLTLTLYKDSTFSRDYYEYLVLELEPTSVWLKTEIDAQTNTVIIGSNLVSESTGGI